MKTVFIFVLSAFLLLPIDGIAPDFFNKATPIGNRVSNWGGAENGTTLLFVGDIMLSRAIGRIMESQDDWFFPFRLISEKIERADIAFANLENPVSLRGEDRGSTYSFRADPRALSGLSKAGFDIVSIANNHMFDWGRDAFVDTMAYLEGAGIRYAGGGENMDLARRPMIIEHNGTKFAFLAYSQFSSFEINSPGPVILPIDIDLMLEDIASAKLISDVVIVSTHWGEEYETQASQKQKDIARALIDVGASLIIGHHPHVIQEIEEYGGGLIAYSLGNFVFDQNFSEDTRSGLILEVFIKGGELEGHNTTIVNFNKTYQPFIP